MIELSSIKERLHNINDAEFQELCDSFLSLKNLSYKAFSRTGAHDTKQKTTTGTPDFFFLLPNGNYIFVESTTTEHKGQKLINKLKADVSSCLEENKTKIPIRKIQEIILCYNSNLNLAEIEAINQLAISVLDKPPTHYSLDRLANEIFFHHRNLAHYYLNLPLDTGQIVSLKRFVEGYDNGKQKLATPLSGFFLHRNQKLEKIQERLESDDIVIISGPAGVGKSKLAIEAITKFSERHLDYNSYAFSTNGVDIFADLGSYFEGESKNILLVDDVNRVHQFDQILGFYHGSEKHQLKLVLTVRDYAAEVVQDWLYLYKNSIVKIGRFNHQELRAIIEHEPYGIQNGDVQNKIFSISKGNARLAIMMVLLLKKTNDLESLNNVSDLFNQYFETFTHDEDSFKEKKILKALGILSFFHTLPYSDTELLDEVARSFSVSSDQLREAFDKLHELDLIELNYHHVRIGEQNLSTYFFYKVFIKDQLLSFESLWKDYFEKYEHRFRDTVYPMSISFGKEFITQKIKPTLLSHWSEIQADDQKAFHFLNFSWKFMMDDCLAYLEEQISSLEAKTTMELRTDYETNDFSFPNKMEKHLSLLATFFKEHTYFLDAIELSFQFVTKRPEHLPQLIYRIDQNFSLIDDDYSNTFNRQTCLLDYMINESHKSRLHALSLFAISPQLLKYFRWSYKSEGETDDPYIISAKLIRSKILEATCEHYDSYPNEVFKLLFALSIESGYHNKYTLAFDLSYLISWVPKNLNPSSFQHCYYVQELIRSSMKLDCYIDSFDQTKLTFQHESYDLFELVTWDRRRAKEDYEFEDWREFERLKRKDIANALTFESVEELRKFIFRYREIIENKQVKLYSQFIVIEEIIRINLSKNTEIGFLTFLEFAKIHDEGRFESEVYISFNSIDHLCAFTGLTERLWEVIERGELDEIWKLEILTGILEDKILGKHLDRLYATLNEVNKSVRVQFKRLKKYETVDSMIFPNVLKTIIRRIEEDGSKIFVREEFFVHLGNLDVDTELLKKAYLQQNELDHHFDYDGKGLVSILKRDPTFLLDFIKEILEKNQYERAREHKELGAVWNLENVEELLDVSLEYLAGTLDHYSISEHFANAFFHPINVENERADNYLLGLVERLNEKPEIMYIVFDIIHNSRGSLFEEAFLMYIHNNQDIECFKRVCWIKRQNLYSGHEIVGAVKAAKWDKLLKLLEKVRPGVKTLSIRNHIKKKIDIQLQRAEEERKRKFFRRV